MNHFSPYVYTVLGKNPPEKSTPDSKPNPFPSLTLILPLIRHGSFFPGGFFPDIVLTYIYFRAYIHILEHSNLFTFFTDLKNSCDEFSPDILNLVNLLMLETSSVDVSKISNILTNSDILSSESPNLSSSNKISESSNELFSEREVQLNSATIRNNRYDGKFFSPNIINLSSRHLSRDEISLLSKGLKFVPTPKHKNKAKIKEEIEVYGRKLRLMWHFRNDHREFNVSSFKKKSKFNPKGTLS